LAYPVLLLVSLVLVGLPFMVGHPLVILLGKSFWVTYAVYNIAVCAAPYCHLKIGFTFFRAIGLV
jgi:hypothetical protein